MSILNEKTNYIFIDGSYFIFYRIFSTLTWWKNANADKDPLADKPILENSLFMDKFNKTFANTLANLSTHLSIQGQNNHVVVARDCPREDIWRTALFPAYKGTRVRKPGQENIIRDLFKYVYRENLFLLGTTSEKILFHPHLEADDCIALSVRALAESKSWDHIFIIASDKDYLQCASPGRIFIMNLAFKNIAECKSSHDNPECDLFCKIVMGDTSDNISSVLKKCGPKTAMKCWQDRAYFQTRLEKESAQEKYQLNQTLVDFRNIPDDLVKEFYSYK